MRRHAPGEEGARIGVSIPCPAKVNLFLRVLAREDTGYHQIETLFQAVGLYDRIEVRAGDPGIALDIVPGETAPGLGDLVSELQGRDDNTVMRAAHAFFGATRIAPAVTLVLTKSIPAGTGLGGASTDAAGTLVALNALHGQPLQSDRLLEIGGTIGTDVPFFCAGSPAAIAWGRGDRLLTCPPPPPATLAVIIPEDRIATATAYRDVARNLTLPAPPRRLQSLAEGTWEAIAALQANDFEAGAFARFPVFAEVRALLEGEGALIARMTGSGSAIFGVFTDPGRARHAAGRAGMTPGVVASFTAPTLMAMPRADRETPRGM